MVFYFVVYIHEWMNPEQLPSMKYKSDKGGFIIRKIFSDKLMNKKYLMISQHKKYTICQKSYNAYGRVTADKIQVTKTNWAPSIVHMAEISLCF